VAQATRRRREATLCIGTHFLYKTRRYGGNSFVVCRNKAECDFDLIFLTGLMVLLAASALGIVFEMFITADMDEMGDPPPHPMMRTFPAGGLSDR